MSKLSTIQNEIKAHFHYDPTTGIITRLTRANSDGSIDKDGYLILKFKTWQIKSHRLAWFLFWGMWPNGVIDHINGNKLDNRIENLRDVHQAVNVRNTKVPPNKDTGYPGICLDKKTPGLKKKYYFRHNKKTLRFYTIDEAVLIKNSLV